MKCKYTAELSERRWYDGRYYLTLRIEKAGTEWNVEREITPYDLQVDGVFDMIFDDMKKLLKHEVKQHELSKVQ